MKNDLIFVQITYCNLYYYFPCMLIITDVLNELWLDMQTFAKHYEKALDKKLSKKTQNIAKKDLELIKKSVSTSSKKSSTKKITQEEKVLKASEFLWWWGGFLSWLGFVDEESEKETEEQEEKEEKIIPTTDDLLKNSIAHKQHHESSSNNKSKSSEPQNTSRVRTNTPRTRTTSTERWNLNFTKSEYTPNAKRVEKPRVESRRVPVRTVAEARAAPRRDPSKAAPQHGSQSTNKPHYQNNNRTHNNHNRNNLQRRGPVSTVRKAEATPAQTKKPKIATTSANLVKKQEVIIGTSISVKEFSEKLGIPFPEVIKVLMKNKLMLWISSSMDFDTATLIADELGVIVKQEENVQLDVESFMEWDLQAILAMDKVAPYLKERAPIVTVMGHVDHGKTSLLDYLRKTSVAGGEAWGITQWIWASVVNYNGKKISFIDTPGHALFTELRARWSKLTNIAVIVVAADDSVMPQTIESINHAKSAWIPIIIAVTKIDKPGKNMEQIKSDLATYWITPEDWGGDSPIVWISSVTWEWIPELLETIVLQAEMLELKYNPQRAAVWVVLDAYKDPKQGVISTVIVMTGTLKVWDVIVAYNTYGKVRRMQDWTWKVIKSATGGDPVQILWITELPEAGRVVEVVNSEKEAHDKITLIQEQTGKKAGSSAVQEFLTKLQSTEHDETYAELRLILKSGGASSLSALKQAVSSIKVPSNVEITIVHSDVWHFSDSDLSLWQASSSLLIGFGISINSSYKKKADVMWVTVKNFDIIYELTAYLEEMTQWMIKYEQIEVVIAKLNVLWIFFSKGKEMTIWGKILEWKLKNKVHFRVLRDDEILATGNLLSLHKNKDEVKEMNEWEECGLKVRVGKKIEEWDILEFYEMQDKKD